MSTKERLEEIHKEAYAEGVVWMGRGVVRELLDHIAQIEAQRGVPERAAWLTIDEMASTLSGFGLSPTTAIGFARAIAAASVAKGKRQRGANVLSSCANCAQSGHCVHAKLGEACEDHIFQRCHARV